MKNNKIVPIILVSVSCLLFIVAIVLLLNTNYFAFTNKTENKTNNQSQEKEENSGVNLENDSNSLNDKENTQDENTNLESNNQSQNDSTDSVINSSIIEENEIESNNENNSSKASIIKNEINVISYFESQEEAIIENSNQEDSTLSGKAKNAFVTIIDFIFYDKEVKGYTFKELTTKAKLKVIQLALSIDHKIDQYFPDYKETIKDKYTDIKGKLAIKYLEFTSTLCDSVGADTCHQAKEDFNNMKESFGFTWELIKELASSGSEKVKEFYESWRDSE